MEYANQMQELTERLVSDRASGCIHCRVKMTEVHIVRDFKRGG